VALAGLSFSACSRAPGRPVDRLAVLPFENLTGDSALDWMASAAPAMVTAELSGNPKLLAIRAGSVNDGYLASADRMVHGFFVKRGGTLRIQVEVEDASRHKMVARAVESGDLLPAMNAIAKRLDSSAHPFSTASADAVSAWGRHEYERAVGIDPDFGAAWLAWADSLAQRGEASQAVGVTERALSRTGLRSETDRARIDLLAASLRKDAAAREKALGTLVKLEPSDTSLLSMAAETEMNLRNFTAAAGYFKSTLRVDPSAAGAMNLLGYAEGYGGDLDAARKTLEEYGRQAGQKTNSLDSLGEVYFVRGHFSDAEKYFLQAYQGEPTFGDGAELMKAAFARWLGGDLTGADGLLLRYLEDRNKLHDPLIVWREAVWDFVTGRRDEALAKLANVPSQLANRQRAVWLGHVSDGLAALKEGYDRSTPPSDGAARVFYAAALLADGQKEAARKLLELWPLPVETGGDATVESLVFPKFIESRRALGLSTDGR
jgi:tetratricopeptide (TPR) repeat protein